MMDITLLRPWALLLLVPAVLLWVRYWRLGGRQAGWEHWVDAHLLTHLLEGDNAKRGRWFLAALGLAWLAAVAALAGPSFRAQTGPAVQLGHATVVALDLSTSMQVADLAPSRLERARLQLAQLFENAEGQVGLMVFAGDAFVVVPLTEDAETVGTLMADMTPELMPAQGSRIDLALAKAQQMLAQSRQSTGRILLLADGVAASLEAASDEARTLREAGFELGVIGIGTAQGGPIPGRRGFIQDADGRTVVSRLEAQALQAIAMAAEGQYWTLTDLEQGDADLQAWMNQAGSNAFGQGESHLQPGTVRQDDGYWLLLPLLLASLLLFRRGLVAAVLLPAVATLTLGALPSTAEAGFWEDLWASTDQQAAQRYQQQDYSEASGAFEHPQWAAEAAYRDGNYELAAQRWAELDDPGSQHNRGNALMQLGRYEEAIEAYEQALAQQPKQYRSALNKQLAERILAQQQEQQQQDSAGGEQGEQPDQKQQQSGDSEQQQGEQQQGQGQQQQEQAGQQSSPTQQQGQADSRQSEQGAEEQAEKSAQAQTEESQQSPEKPEQAKAAQSATEAQQQEQEQQAAATADAMSPEEREQQVAQELQMRQIPDDPGGLWRRKFRYQYGRREGRRPSSQEQQAW